MNNKIVRHSEKEYFPVNLSEYFNNDGISFDNLKSDGSFDGPGSTYPAEELPNSNSLITVDNIPFFFPSKNPGDKNNILTSSQIITIDENYYENLYLLGAVDGQKGEVFEEEFLLSFHDQTCDTLYIGLSNWLLQSAFRERIAFVCSHLHWPDYGQEINRNLFSPNYYVDYKNLESSNEYFSRECILGKDFILNSSDWKPKIWIQRVELPFDKKIQTITLPENLNYHIFSLTLSLKAK